MGKEEMKNKISIALKNPVLQIGFEIICKNLSELEKENAELKEKLEHRNCVDCSNHGSNIKLFKAKEILKVVLNKWKEERWILQSEKEVKMIENVMKEAEQFLEGLK